ncbi:MAG TPA: putative zinc-binding metallopeptidase [Ohtaekwangia sp.]|nr:putative zinc-binding metallopeptidase [Ohtaekwangia sp.]
MRHTTPILLTIFLGSFAISCEDSYNDAVDPSKTDYVTNDEQHPRTALDTWLLDNFTYPYNIEVKYKWDASEGDMFRTLVPPKVSQVEPLMDVVKKAWIDPYADLAGGAFIKTYCPKQFLLIGSARYNLDGTFTLGTAEGGRKVVLYVVNQFVPQDRSALKTMMHIVHHEFGHILNQKVSYPSAFREITPGAYTSDWRFRSVAEARASGFITNYAMASPDEDFVEMVATMLMEGKDGYESILTCDAGPAARQILQRKEALVIQYFRESFNIDFHALQAKVQEAIDAIAPPDEDPETLPPLMDVFGYGKENTAVRFDLSMLNEPAEFVARYAQDNTILHNAGIGLDYNFKIFFTAENEMALRVYYYNLADDERIYQQANFYYFLEWTGDGKVMMSLGFGDDNAVYLSDLQATALAAFFADRSFEIDWLQTCTGQVYVAFYPQDAPENYCFGMLEN